MTAAALFGVLLPSVVVYVALVRLFSRSSTPFGRPLAVALAPACGLGLASCLYFLLLLMAGRNAVLWLDASFWLAAAGGLLLDRSRSNPPQSHPSFASGGPREWRPAVVLAAVGCAAAVMVAAAAVWLHLDVMPHGESDAIAIWNLRARSIVRSAPDWATVLSPAIGWSNPDYPLLVPLTVARLWSYGGGEGLLVPQLVSMLYFLSSVATVGTLVAAFKGRTAGLLSAIAVVAARTYVFQTSCQCADVPLGFYVLVATSFAVVAQETRAPGSCLVIAGAAAALAAWTKNEGQLLLIVVGLFAVAAFPKGRLRSACFAAAGAALPFVALAVFKAFLAPPTGLVALQTGDVLLGKLVDPDRWTAVLSQAWTLFWQWGGVPGGAIAGVGIGVLLTVRADRPSIRRAALGLTFVLALLAGYAVTYVITPWPLAWHIATSFERLIVQLWPAAVWALFQLTGGPAARTGAVGPPDAHPAVVSDRPARQRASASARDWGALRHRDPGPEDRSR